MKKDSETPPAELQSLPAQIHVLDNSPIIAKVPLPVFTSSPTGQDIPARQESPPFFGATPHLLEQLESPMSIEPSFPASHYSPPILPPTFQHDVNMASSGMQQFSHVQQYGNNSNYQDYTNGHDYEPQAYDQNSNYQSHEFNVNGYGDYGVYDYPNGYGQ
jgi:hypothetical protein